MGRERGMGRGRGMGRERSKVLLEATPLHLALYCSTIMASVSWPADLISSTERL